MAATLPWQQAAFTASPSYRSDKPKSEASSGLSTGVTRPLIAADHNLAAIQHDTALQDLSVKITEAMALLELLDSEHHWLKDSESKSLSLKKRRAARSRFVEISGRLDTFSSEAFDNLSNQLDSGAIAINPELLARLCLHRGPRD